MSERRRPRRSGMRLGALVCIAIAAVLSGCGDADTTPRQAFVDDATDAVMAGGTWLSRTEARCLVAGQVDVLGFENLASAGVTPQEIGAARMHALSETMTGPQRSAMIRLIPECDIAWSSWWSGGTSTPSQDACARQIATDAEFTEVYASAAADPDRPGQPAPVDDFIACFS